jgi:hypothetical protein
LRSIRDQKSKNNENPHKNLIEIRNVFASAIVGHLLNLYLFSSAKSSVSLIMDISLLSNPINIALFGVFAFALYSSLKPKAVVLKPAVHSSSQADTHLEPIVLQDFTPKELSEFDGRKSKKIYLSIGGKV